MTAETNATQGSPLFGGGASGVGANGGVLGAGNFYFALLYAPYTGVQAPVPSTPAALGTWSDTGLEAQSTASAGRLAPINGNAGAIVPWSPGTTDSIVMVGWSANLGTSWNAVEAELENWANNQLITIPYLGFSATGYITPLATTTSPGATVFGSAPTAQGLPIYSPKHAVVCLGPALSGAGTEHDGVDGFGWSVAPVVPPPQITQRAAGKAISRRLQSPLARLIAR